MQLKRDELTIKAQEAQASIVKMQSEAIENTAQAQHERALAAQTISDLQVQIQDVTQAFEQLLDFESEQLLQSENGSTSEPADNSLDFEEENI